jgi:very-short-patch-repair endonuclease
VYRSPLYPVSPQQHALAAVLWAGDGALASHVTAAWLYGFEVSDDRSHVWVPPGRAPKSSRVVVHRGVVAGNDRRISAGVPVTSPARTLVDLAGVLDGEELEAVVEGFLHRGLTTPMSISRCLTANGGKGRAGSARLRTLLEDRDPKALESRLEVKVWRLLRRYGLRPARQHQVRIGGVPYRLDFAWPALKVAVEADGFSAHGDQRSFVLDRRRLAALVAAGWAVIPVTWDDCKHTPDAIIATVKSALLHAAA